MNVTNEQITALRTEAAAAGDEDMVAVCSDALSGDVFARKECEKVIAGARARSMGVVADREDVPR